MGWSGEFPVLAQRAVSEDPRWTRAVGNSSGPSQSTVTKQAWRHYLDLLTAALRGRRRVLARQGWAGEKVGLFEHPALCFSFILYVAVRPMSAFSRRAGLLLLILITPSILYAGDKIAGTLTVHDSLTAPNQPVTIIATVTKTGPLAQAGSGGASLELVIAGNVVATAMTGTDGRASLPYIPKAKGAVPFTVRAGNTTGVALTEAGGNLAVWERRSPIVAVEMAALMESAVGEGTTVIKPGDESEVRRPMSDAAEELSKLTQFYYNVLYVVTMENGVTNGDQANAQARQWLKDQKFPIGHILVLPSDPEALGAKLDEMHLAGWTQLKTGIGRTKVFAESFLQRRLEAVMVPEPAKGEAPRKAKVAKEWKEVRKKM